MARKLKKGRWTPEDIEILKREYPRLLSREVAEMLGRPEPNVRKQAQRLGLAQSIGRR